MILFLAAAASATATPAFDLSRPEAESLSREQAAPRAPNLPRGVDTRDIAIDPPEVELALLDAKVGPVLRVGALGGRHGAAPKLAHLAVDWRF
jgi:hypothetical protein